MPTNTTIFNIPKPSSSEVFNLTNFNSILDAIESGVSGKVQMTKLTDSSGGVKVNATNTSDDILALLLAQGKGIHTFYNIAGAVNNPASVANIRGVSHFTATNSGWVFAIDTNNIMYTNSYDVSSWKGWSKIAIDRAPTFTTLALQNGATVNSSRTPKFLKQGNIVVVQGEISNVIGVIGTLPSGYRPGYAVQFRTTQATSTAGADATIEVGTDGTINVKSTSNSSPVVLSGITFIAEQ